MSDKYSQKWTMLLARKGNSNNAVTIGQTTYYSAPRQEVDRLPLWRRHEEWHKKQWRDDGRIKFIFKYLWYQIRYGYYANPYEIEARQAAYNNWPQ